MFDIYALSQIGGKTPAAQSWPGVSLREREMHSLASAALRRGRAPDGQWPETERVIRQGDRTILWTAMGQVLVERPGNCDLAADLKARHPDLSITEQTGAFSVFDLTGADAIEVLRKLVMLDLDRFATGRISRTLVEHIGIYLYRPSAEAWRIYAPSSTARSTWHALVTACETQAALTKDQ